MGLSPILSIIHAVTINTMLNFNGGNNGHGLKNVTYKQIFTGNAICALGFSFTSPILYYFCGD